VTPTYIFVLPPLSRVLACSKADQPVLTLIDNPTNLDLSIFSGCFLPCLTIAFSTAFRRAERRFGGNRALTLLPHTTTLSLR
jgi:hypothetical protein